MVDDEDESWRLPEPLAPEHPSLENAVFVLIGMIAMLLVLVYLFLLFT